MSLLDALNGTLYSVYCWGGYASYLQSAPCVALLLCVPLLAMRIPMSKPVCMVCVLGSSEAGIECVLFSLRPHIDFWLMNESTRANGGS